MPTTWNVIIIIIIHSRAFLQASFPCLVLTWVAVRGHNGEDGCSDGDVLVNLLGIALRIKDWRIVVQVQDVAVHGERSGQTGLAIVLRLDHEDVVLYLEWQEMFMDNIIILWFSLSAELLQRKNLFLFLVVNFWEELYLGGN